MKARSRTDRQKDLNIRALKSEAVMQEVATSDPSHNRRVADDERVVGRCGEDAPAPAGDGLIETGQCTLHGIDVCCLNMVLGLNAFDCLVQALTYLVDSNGCFVRQNTNVDLPDCPARGNLQDLVIVGEKGPQRLNLNLGTFACRVPSVP
jgi:hypothetical protein